jgi:peptide/nickel transport system permease protein
VTASSDAAPAGAPVGVPVAADTARRDRIRDAARALRAFVAGSPLNAMGIALLVLVVGAALFGDRLVALPPDQMSLLERLRPPSLAHPFGTDDFGRDILSRVVSGAAISLQVAAVVLGVAVVVGTAAGAIAGLFGGLVDELLMRLTDLFLAFPALILAAAISATLGANLTTTMLALATVYWPWYARLVRGQILTLREREYILAARAVGVGSARIITRHLLPNVLPLIILQASLDVGYVILATSALSFLGLGAQPPTPEWGAMLTDARAYLRDAWWFPTFPGVALALTVFTFNVLGDGLRDWLDPRLRRR